MPPFDINDPEAKAALDAAVAEAVKAAKDEATAAAAALQANNAKLLKELREAKKEASIDPAKHAALEDRVAELEGLLSTAEANAKKQAKELSGQVETLTKKLQSESGFTQTLLVDNGLSDALVKAGVEPQFMPAVKAMLKAQVQVVAEGDQRRAMAGDKPLTDFVSQWAQSDEGKHFVKAPANSGGGGTGGGGAAGGKTTISATDKAALGANLEELAKGVHGNVQIA